jgi:hypothetical protein
MSAHSEEPHTPKNREAGQAEQNPFGTTRDRPGWPGMLFGTCPCEYLACALQWAAAPCLITGWFVLGDSYDQLATLLVLLGVGMAFAGVLLAFFGEVCGPAWMLAFVLGALAAVTCLFVSHFSGRLTGHSPAPPEEPAGLGDKDGRDR